MITKRLFDAIDLSAMYPNVITTHEFNFGKIPLIADSDEAAFKMCIYGCGKEDMESVRLVRIKNTLELEKIYVSQAMVDEVRSNPKLEMMGEPIAFAFDQEGSLITGF